MKSWKCPKCGTEGMCQKVLWEQNTVLHHCLKCGHDTPLLPPAVRAAFRAYERAALLHARASDARHRGDAQWPKMFGEAVAASDAARRARAKAEGKEAKK